MGSAERTRVHKSKLGGRWLESIASASRADMQENGCKRVKPRQLTEHTSAAAVAEA